MSNSSVLGRRVVITGIGVMSPIGIGIDAFWESLSAGRSGIARMESVSYSASPQNIGAEVTGFDAKSARKIYLKAQRKSLKVMCREIQLGVASATLSLENSNLNLDEIDHDRFGVEFGANLMLSPPEVLKDACRACAENGDGHQFQYDQWGTIGLQNMEPLWLLRYLPNMPACHIGISADARGPNNSITLAEASGNLALGEARRVILRGAADVMITGTTGTQVHPVKAIHAKLWDQLAESSGPPETWYRPFDLNRNGQVIGEGACSFILEEESHARNRGAHIYGSLLGAGSSCVSDREGKPEIKQALVNAMRTALNDAGLSPEDIGHFNAHGLGSKESDVYEAQAILHVFGKHAETLPVTALKSYFGNAGSGTGTLEMAGSLIGLQHGVVPATLNFKTPDPDCPLNIVHGESLAVGNKRFMSVNVTRMGQASAIIAEAA